MNNPFKDLTVTIDTYGYKHITWSVNGLYKYPQNCVLSLQYARSGSDKWITLQSNITDACEYIDYERRNSNKKVNDYYRLILSVPNTTQSYTSDPVAAGKHLIFPGKAQVSNLFRLAQKEIDLTGRNGVLLKKKVWGPRCPDCTDFDNENSVNEHCPTCLGTGIIGGYYKGIPMGILEQAQQTAQQVDSMGPAVGSVMGAKCVAWPWIHQGDVWADTNTNQRFYIDQVNVISKYRGFPIVYMLQMKLLELTDVLHSVSADAKFSNDDTTDFVTTSEWDLNS